MKNTFTRQEILAGIVATAMVAIIVFSVVFTPVAHADRTPVTAIQGTIVTGSCNTASSTLFALQPPNFATSTLAYFKIVGTNGATSTDIVIATSSTPYTSGFTQATSTLGENIMGLATIPVGKQFESVAGLKFGPSKGYNSAGGGAYITNAMTEVGPTESVIAYATTTNIAGGGLNIAVPTTCSYEAIWYQ